MGLDIYFHKTIVAYHGDAQNPTTEDVRDFIKRSDKESEDALKKFIDQQMKTLRKLWDKAQTNKYWVSDYNLAYFEFVHKLKSIIAKNYDHAIYPFVKEVLPIDELEKALENAVKMYGYNQYTAYFRKVNFIFRYFEKKMFDQSFAFVDTDDVDDLIYRCEQVLKDHSKADKLLATRDGCFFGSTNYDDWFFEDVRDCLKQMKHFRKGLDKDGVTAYVIFSW